MRQWIALLPAALCSTIVLAATEAVVVPVNPPPQQPAPTVNTTVTNVHTGPATTTTAPATSTTTVNSDTQGAPVTTTTTVVPAQNVPQSNLAGTDDRTIRETIEARLGNQPALLGTDISVISSGGIVTLSGNAVTDAQVAMAISIARSIPGVKEVRSDIVLQNP